MGDGSSMSDFAFAAKFRDVIASIAQSIIQQERPSYRYATVTGIDRTNMVCYGYFDTDITSVVTVRMGSIQPDHLGQIIRVGGITGDRFVDDVIGPAYELPVNKPPVGVINLWGGNTAPLNYLMCDGSAISRVTYADLFAVIGTAYGVGNGSTTFNLPNFNNLFIRGGSPGVGGGQLQHQHDAISAGTPVGTISTHTHHISASPVTDVQGAHAHSVILVASSHDHGGTGTTGLNQQGNTTATGASNRLTSPDPHSHSLTNVSHDHTGSNTGAQAGHSHSVGNGWNTDGNVADTFTGQQLPTHQHNLKDHTPQYMGVQFIIRALV